MAGLGGETEAIFEALVSAERGADVAELRAEIVTYLARYEEAAQENALLPLDIAQALALGLDELLATHAALAPEHQPLVVAAARYFVSEDDARPDTESVLGLDDDVEVFNHVVTAIGLPERKIDL